MIDPNTLRTRALAVFDPALIVGEYDRDEPFVIEHTRLTTGDVGALAGVPVTANSCVFESCDLSMSDIIGVRNSLFINCKLRGARFGRFVRNVVFDSCQLSDCTFRMMALEKVMFQSCHLAGCDFYQSSMEQISFPDSTIEGVGFDQCTLTDVDLTQAADLMIGDPRTLSGAAICETQVPLIARRLAELSGIEVRDC